MLELARSEERIACELDVFDRDPWLLNAGNGTIDLRTGVLTPHCREDLITKLCGAAVDMNAPCPAWDAFLHRIFDGNAAGIGFVQRAAGYSLVGITSEQVLLFLYGTGKNGRSTFLEVLKAVLGGYAATADFSAFTTKKTETALETILRACAARGSLRQSSSSAASVARSCAICAP